MRSSDYHVSPIADVPALAGQHIVHGHSAFAIVFTNSFSPKKGFTYKRFALIIMIATIHFLYTIYFFIYLAKRSATQILRTKERTEKDIVSMCVHNQ